MGKTTEAGIDVSKAVLDVAVRRDERQLETARFANDPTGHQAVVRWLTKGGRTVRVVLESTGTYSLDVALALHRTRGIAVMVANPRAIKQFTGALLQRATTDLTAAVALRDRRHPHAVRRVAGVLPDAMTVRQWVAHAGLDPRAHQSGTSVDKPARISKVGNAHSRRALFMPALVAVQHDRHGRAFFDKLVARGKTPLQAYVAVMRKLLHAIYGMFTRDLPRTGRHLRCGREPTRRGPDEEAGGGERGTPAEATVVHAGVQG
jgi:transposase